MKKIIAAALLALGLGTTSCDYLELEPVGQVIPHTTYEYRSLLTEGYFRFPYTESRSLIGLLTDELDSFEKSGFLVPTEAIALNYNFSWDYGINMRELPYEQFYRAIFIANAVIDGVMTADNDHSEKREQILAEAYALRAYSHFSLVNIYSVHYNAQSAASDRAIPLYDHIDIEQEFHLSTVEKIYSSIFEDIAKAEENMVVEKQENTDLNYRFSKDAVTAFKSRALLYTGEWEKALTAAEQLIGKYKLSDMNTLKEKDPLPWQAESSEAIMAWERPFGALDGDLINASALSKKMLDLLPEGRDNRRKYIGHGTDYNSFSPTAYNIVVRSTKDRSTFRVSEMYLTAAESAARLNNTDKARKYLLDLQATRFTPSAMEAQRTAVEKMNAEALLQEIMAERAREFLMEGHRWFDLRRTTRPEIVKTLNGNTVRLNAGDARYTLPFPQSAIEANPNLNR